MNIKVEYLEEAQKYIDTMPEKARRKMLYNTKQEIEHAEIIRNEYYKTR
jgi:hypothetical protein